MPKTKSRPAPTERTSRRPRLHAAARDEPQSVVQAATPQALSSPVEQSAPQAPTTSVCTIPFTEPPVPTGKLTLVPLDSNHTILPLPVGSTQFSLGYYVDPSTRDNIISGPLFCHYSGQPLTRYQFSSVLAKALQVLGINSKYYKSHSFRIGAATMLAQQGLSEQAIQASGRWHSQAYRSYIRIGGTNLSIPNANIWWQGYSGMKLLDLVPKLKYLKGLKLQSPPHIIVVHCGVNNVGKTRLDRLLTMVHDILSQCKTLFPKTKFVWSSTLPRITWRYSTNAKAMYQTRTRVNRQAIKTMVSLGGAYIKHPQIKISHTQLFHSDGTHLSELGNDLFLKNLQGAIEHIMGVKTK
uniref:Tyr recombinase domain-containing protein n=1 Tax=Magallana gigas TaxID=29159 RepID=A0A8W8M4Z2_MAGGI